MATLAESFMADLDELSDVTEDEDNLQQPDADEEVRSAGSSVHLLRVLQLWRVLCGLT